MTIAPNTLISETNVSQFQVRDSLEFSSQRDLLLDILRKRRLEALFQPILNLKNAHVIGHEALIRGPDGPLHMPMALLEAAQQHGLTMEVECLCHQTVMEAFAQKRPVMGKLFLNLSPAYLASQKCQHEFTYESIHALGLIPQNMVIEITENSSQLSYAELREAADYYRNMGFEIAMDDLGEGFSSLRLWNELQPDYVKLDKHFIQGINADSLKLEFVKSIQRIAENSGAKMIAEGIESLPELSVVKQLKINFGQGFLFSQPTNEISYCIEQSILDSVLRNQVYILPTTRDFLSKKANLSKLVKYVPPVTSDLTNDEIFEIFGSNPGLYSIAVVDNNRPVGLISRYTLIDSFAKPYSREIFGKKSCQVFMDTHSLVVERDMSLHALSDLITNMEPHHLSNGYIVTKNGEYLGLGSGHDLLREITQMQLRAARYANPLTLLPGNVPINEHVDQLLNQDLPFSICYCDLDNFKPFNDAYGFDRGDDLIKYTGKLISSVVSPEEDFVGHIGGDDFIIVFQSRDWQTRCQRLLDELSRAIPSFYDVEDIARNGIESKDRQGRTHVYPLGTMSIGAVQVTNKDFANHHEVFGAVSRAKKHAKSTSGNSFFLERRTHKKQ